MMITDEAGRPLAVTDLNGAELRALRVLAGAGMIPPLDELTAASAQGVLIERDFTDRPRKAPASKPRKAPVCKPRTAASAAQPTTRTAVSAAPPATKAS